MALCHVHHRLVKSIFLKCLGKLENEKFEGICGLTHEFNEYFTHEFYVYSTHELIETLIPPFYTCSNAN